MGTTLIAPEVEPPVETIPEPVDEPAPAEEPKPVGWKQRVHNLLVAIFEGHEEFLGWTPD